MHVVFSLSSLKAHIASVVSCRLSGRVWVSDKTHILMDHFKYNPSTPHFHRTIKNEIINDRSNPRTSATIQITIEFRKASKWGSTFKCATSACRMSPMGRDRGTSHQSIPIGISIGGNPTVSQLVVHLRERWSVVVHWSLSTMHPIVWGNWESPGYTTTSTTGRMLPSM